MKRKPKPLGSIALKIVQQYFPKVKTVKDADKPAYVEVQQRDVDWANDKDHKTCALAVACKRTFKADGVLIGLTRSYIIIGQVAFRYDNTNTVSREITSFDRKAGFDVGVYHLTPISPSNRMGAPRHGGPSGGHNKKSELEKSFRHHTKGVRTVLGDAKSV